MTTDTSEKGLEIIIEKSLLEVAHYRPAFSADYDRDLCLNKRLLFEFIKETQPAVYETIVKRGEDKFLKRLYEQVKQRGSIDVLRKGVKDLDLGIQLYFKHPSSELNPKAIKLYNSNIFAVTRQLRYSLNNNNSLDLAILINGLPIITFELKNPWTGQNVKHAIQQYQNDRDPKEPLFQFGRCFVHFAVDPDLIYMATHLNGANTFFLPLNKGFNNGAGNPPNPEGIKTDYLWKDILTKPALRDCNEIN